MRNPKVSEVEGAHNLDIKLYPRRWFLLALFMMYACVVSMHWTQFSSVTSVMARYYNVPGSQVEWTAIMCMAARAFILFPALFLMDRLDTRNTLILGSTLCLIGASVKFFSVSPDRFHVVLTGQVFSALAIVFTYSIVARIAADWFSSDEISKAGALGCVGDQFGGALGFLFPSLLVPDDPVVEEVEKGMRRLQYVYVATALSLVILIITFFKSKPKRPPSAAQVRNRSNKTQGVYESVKKNLGNLNFMFFTLSHSFVVGLSLNGYGTLLNEMIVTNFPDSSKHVGIIGCINFMSGMIGSVVVSYILDKTRKFKGNAVTLSTVNCICLASCAVAMKSGNIIYLYVTYTIFGFFLQAYYATGIQMGIELTFPVPEGITVAMMSTGIEVCSMFAASVLGVSVRVYGDFVSTMVLTFFVFLSTLIVCLVPAKFRREELEKAAKLVEMKEFLPDPERRKYFT